MDFRKQIREDIELIKDKCLKFDSQLKKDEYAFNYWVLSKLYNIDEEIIFGQITEYRDDAVDCFVFYEDTKDLFLIQNKHYGDNTKLTLDYVQKEFLLKPIDTLVNENYKRSEELQKIFTKYKNDSEFSVTLSLYVTNNLVDDKVKEMFKRFPETARTKYGVQAIFDSNIYYLSDIESTYYGERYAEKKKFKCSLHTINKGTVMNIDSDNYGLDNLIKAKYIFTPVYQLYTMLKVAKESKYPLFSDNIREYLGSKGINKRIENTLSSEEERKNFFYYNNGVTIICDSIKELNSTSKHYNKEYQIDNPQIVNGCQTVNSIFQVLDKVNPTNVEKDFKDAYVMVKVLVLNAADASKKQLYEDIVKYNNSQNKIDDKFFQAIKDEYMNIQKDFMDRGFFVTVKQSDKEKFNKENKIKFNEYKQKALKYCENFEIEIYKFSDLIIPLEKLLQSVVAFGVGGYEAYVKKPQILKVGTKTSELVNEYIKSISRNELLFIYLLFLKAEKEKNASEEGRTPVPFYLLGFLGEYIGNDKERRKKILSSFNNQQTIRVIYSVFRKTANMYVRKINVDYNTMIKTPIDKKILKKAHEDSLADHKEDNKELYDVYVELIGE